MRGAAASTQLFSKPAQALRLAIHFHCCVSLKMGPLKALPPGRGQAQRRDIVRGSQSLGYSKQRKLTPGPCGQGTCSHRCQKPDSPGLRLRKQWLEIEPKFILHLKDGQPGEGTRCWQAGGSLQAGERLCHQPLRNGNDLSQGFTLTALCW